jgi:hypothetical protein
VVLGNADPTQFNLESTGSVGRGSGGSTFYSIPYLRDSAIVGIGSTLLVLLLAAPAAYALSRFALRWRRDFAFWILSQRMMPPIVAAFPLFFMFRRFGLIDTYQGLILVHAAINIPLAVLLLMSFFDEVPRDLDDAACGPPCRVERGRVAREGHLLGHRSQRRRQHRRRGGVVEVGSHPQSLRIHRCTGRGPGRRPASPGSRSLPFLCQGGA